MTATTTGRLRDTLAVLAGIYLVLLQSNLMNAPRSIVLGLMGVVALAVIVRPDARAELAWSNPARAIAVAFVACAAWSVASLAWSVDREITRTELRADVFLTAVGTIAILPSVRESVTFRRCITAILAAFAVLAVASVVLAFAASAWNDKLMHHGAGTWSTHIVLVAPLILLLRSPVAAGWGAGRRPTAAAIALVVLALASAYVSGNRMVWPALLAVLAVVGAATLARAASAGGRPGRAATVAFLALAALLAFAFVDAISRKAEWAFPHETPVERSLAEDPRLAIWPLVGEKIAERPWLGHGYGKEILGGELAAKLGDRTLTHAHNTFASVWLQTGAIGLALFVALLAAVAWRFAGYARSRDDALARLGVAGLAILAGVLVKNLTDDFFVRTNLRFLWAVFALMIAFGEGRLREAGLFAGRGQERS